MKHEYRRAESFGEIQTGDGNTLQSAQDSNSKEKAGSQACYFTQTEEVRQGRGLEGFLLPRPCRRMVERVSSFACQPAIGQTLSADLGHGEIEAVGII